MKPKSWATAIGCAFISFIVLWGILERIFYAMPPTRVHILGYKVAGILAFVGITGIGVGIKILKKRQLLATGLIGFFLVPFVIAVLVFIFGP